MPKPKIGPPALTETFSDLERYGATPTALILPDDTSIEECVELGARLGKLETASMFWIGDLLIHSEAHFGEMASQIEDATGYSRGTINQAKYVCSHVKPAIRNSLSFSHHKAVAAVDEELQKHWLAEALKLSLPVDGVTAAIKDLQRMAGVTTQKKRGRPPLDPAERERRAEERSEKSNAPTSRESAALARAAAKAARTSTHAENGAQEPSTGQTGASSNGTGEQLNALLVTLKSLRQAAADLDDQMVEVEGMLEKGDLRYDQMVSLLKQIGAFDTIKHLFIEAASRISAQALGLGGEV